MHARSMRLVPTGILGDPGHHMAFGTMRRPDCELAASNSERHFHE